MKSVKVTIDNRDIEVRPETTILQAARELNLHIPTLCHLNGYELFTSCMLCVVLDSGSGRLIPACSASVSEGMRIVTVHPRVEEARKDALDFLLSEHIGDCEAPCQRACPAHMNIPLMIREIRENNLEQAIATVKDRIALPAVLGRICPAPCEKGCHRRAMDSPVSICSLKRYVADADLSRSFPFIPDLKSDSGRKVAVVGAGPAGLSAAYYLCRYGHGCHIYDRNPKPGGMLRYGVSRENLPESVLESEIDIISRMGVEFRMDRSLGGNLEWKELREEYDALVLATGTLETGYFEKTGIPLTSRGVEVNRGTFQTTVPGVFAGGNAVAESRLAIRAVAHGYSLAEAVDQFLSGLPVTGSGRRFQSTIGKVREEDVSGFIQEADGYPRVEPRAGFTGGFNGEEAVRESSRCFGCDCRKPESCKLREYAERYGADQRRFRFKERSGLEKIIQHDLVIYEPGKCIKCGLCVRIAEKAGERLGLTFIDRGFDVKVGIPFGESFSVGLEKVAGECVAACPTAALSWRDRTRKNDIRQSRENDRSDAGSWPIDP